MPTGVICWFIGLGASTIQGYNFARRITRMLMFFLDLHWGPPFSEPFRVQSLESKGSKFRVFGLFGALCKQGPDLNPPDFLEKSFRFGGLGVWSLELRDPGRNP